MYRIWLLASVHNQRRNLPGVVRQRIKKIQVAVLPIRERPPYDYDDLTELLAQLE